jgi:hypothetical protein
MSMNGKVWFVSAVVAMMCAGMLGCSDSDDGGGGSNGSNASIPDGEKWVMTCTGDMSFTNSTAFVSVGNEDSEDVMLGLNGGDDVSSFFMSSGVTEGTTGTFNLDSVQLLIDSTIAYEGGEDNGTSFELVIDEWETDFFSSGPAGSFDGELKAVDSEATVSCAGSFDFNAEISFQEAE